MLDQGVWAEVKVGREHLRLFSEQNALGVQASVYNVNTKSWIAPSDRTRERSCSSLRNGISTPCRQLGTASIKLEKISLSVNSHIVDPNFQQSGQLNFVET